STVLTQAASIARLCGRALSAPRRGRYHDSRRGRHGPIGFYFSGHPPAPPTPEGKQRSGCLCPAAAGRPLGAGRAFLCTPACTPAPDWASSALFRTYVKLLIWLVAGAGIEPATYGLLFRPRSGATRHISLQSTTSRN